MSITQASSQYKAAPEDQNVQLSCHSLVKYFLLPVSLALEINANEKIRIVDPEIQL